MRILKPMLCQIGDVEDLKNKGFIFEPKLDGVRALCYVNKKLTFYSRNSINITHRFPEFDFRKSIKARTAILDGEIVVYDKKGVPRFSLLQQRDLLEDEALIQHESSTLTATFVVFDILMKNGKKLSHMPLNERKKILQHTVSSFNGILEVIVSTHQGPTLWKAAQKAHLEGVIAKNELGLYYPGKRPPEWFKIKKTHTFDAIIVGYTQEKRTISALALGAYHKGKLIYMGKVGTGFNEQNIASLYKKLATIHRATPAARNAPDLKHIQWVRPIRVCEIEYMEITKARRFRVPVFIRLRSDKDPKECLI